MTEKSTGPEEKYKGWLNSSTCRAVVQAGETEGREYGLAEAMAWTFARLLNRQAKQKFGGADAPGRATLDALAAAFAIAQLEELADRLLSASSWAVWLDGVVAPPPVSGVPEYTTKLEIDFERSGPSIDSHMQVGLVGGGETVIHLRFQKWYQPDLDRHLFEESCKIEKKIGKMPTVVVILMWPPAEGPGMTGRFEERDTRGKIKRVFEYNIRRAWEITPEEMAHSPGTMLLAPLTKDSRRRMPEIVQMLKKGLDKCQADAETQAGVWDAAYWSMGLICDIDEVHRALGDMLPVIQSSRHYLSAKGHSYMDAYTAAQHDEGPKAAARALVLRQATRRFGPLPDAEATLTAIDVQDDLESLALRVLTVGDWTSLLAKP